MSETAAEYGEELVLTEQEKKLILERRAAKAAAREAWSEWCTATQIAVDLVLEHTLNGGGAYTDLVEAFDGNIPAKTIALAWEISRDMLNAIASKRPPRVRL